MYKIFIILIPFYLKTVNCHTVRCCVSSRFFKIFRETFGGFIYSLYLCN